MVDGVGSEGNTNSLYVGSRSQGLQLVARACGLGIGLVYTIVTRSVLGFGTGEEGKTMGLAAIGERYRSDGRVLESQPALRRLDHRLWLVHLAESVRRPPLSDSPLFRPQRADDFLLLENRLGASARDRALHAAPREIRVREDRKAAAVSCRRRRAQLRGERASSQRVAIRRRLHPASVIGHRAAARARTVGLPRAREGPAPIHFTTAFTGKGYERTETEALLDRFEIPYQQADVKTVARLLADGHIVGWLIGGSELGPRALGHRSILADPRAATMKDTLNAKVKHREMFRPFAPSVIEERADDYFVMRGPSPFMLLAPMVRPEAVQRIPAVVHVDGSARVHTVNARDNPCFYDLLVEFENLTGVAVLINTSFNDNGEPIVETPLDALICFLRTAMDYLFIDGVLIDRSQIRDGGLLARLVKDRAQALRAGYRAAIERLCKGYSIGGLRAFLKAYHPMHRYYSSLHTLVKLQEALGSWGAGPIFTDAYHHDIIQRFLPEEHARLADRFVIVEDTHATLDRLTDGSLVILFNVSLWLADRRLVNFYEERWMPVLKPLVDWNVADGDFESSNEYRSSKDWDAFYAELLDEE